MSEPSATALRAAAAGPSGPGPRIDDDTFIALPASIEDRMVPVVTPESEPYWQGLRRGELVIDRCARCGGATHPAVSGCARCGSADVAPEVVAGVGTLYSFSVSYLSFGTGMDPPYVIGIVEVDGEPGLKVVTNIVGCRVSDVRIGMPLEMVVHGDQQPLAFFKPSGSAEPSPLTSAPAGR